MIDKVVRLRTRKGAFGEDYSELINHEKDQERREKFAHFYKLAESRKIEDESSKLDPNDSGMCIVSNSAARQHKERIYFRAKGEVNLCGEESSLNVAAVSKASAAFSYEEWCRKKDTEDRLREQLIQEAKRELKEEMERKEQEESRVKEQGAQKVEEWREAKAKEVAAKLELKRMAHMKKLADEEERREKGRHVFK